MCHTEVTLHTENMSGELKQLKESKLLLNMNKLKKFLQKKVYVHKFYNENYPLSYKKNVCIIFFLFEVSYDFKLHQLNSSLEQNGQVIKKMIKS